MIIGLDGRKVAVVVESGWRGTIEPAVAGIKAAAIALGSVGWHEESGWRSPHCVLKSLKDSRATAEVVRLAVVDLTKIVDFGAARAGVSLVWAEEELRAGVWELQQVLGGWPRFDLRDATVVCRSLSDWQGWLQNALRFWRVQEWAEVQEEADLLLVDLGTTMLALSVVVGAAASALARDGADWDLGAVSRSGRYFRRAAELLVTGEVVNGVDTSAVEPSVADQRGVGADGGSRAARSRRGRYEAAGLRRVGRRAT